MRSVLFLLPPLLLAAPFAACGGGVAASPSADAGSDARTATDAVDDFGVDIPPPPDAAPVTNCKLTGDADPVGLCVQQAALKDLHLHAFAASQGVAASWNSTNQAPDTNDAGAVTYALDDTVAYAAAAANYLASAEVYGDTTINGLLQSDLVKIATLLESAPSLPVPATEYSGELYFHLRTVAGSLRTLGLNSDGNKFDKFAESYGRSLYTGHYVPLGVRRVPAGDAGHDAGPVADGGHDAAVEAGKVTDAAGPVDSGHDATLDATPDAGKTGDAAGSPDAGGEVTDGIFGNPSGDQVAYAPADVATAAYAMLDLTSRNPKDPLVPSWLGAARAALGHVLARAVDPTTGMLYRALLTAKDGDGGVGADTLAVSTDPTLPSNALLADTQATFALTMARAQYLVTTTTVVSLGGLEAGRGPIVDAGVSGPLVPVLDLPFEAWARATIAAMNGTHSLWDGTSGKLGHGYVDGYVPGADGGTGTLITTKSTRANAFMAAAIEKAFVNDDVLPQYEQLAALVQLLVAQKSSSVPLNSNLITVLPDQLAYLRGATQAFLPLEAGPNPMSYTSAAVSAAVEGLTEQMPVQSP